MTPTSSRKYFLVKGSQTCHLLYWLSLTGKWLMGVPDSWSSCRRTERTFLCRATDFLTKNTCTTKLNVWKDIQRRHVNICIPGRDLLTPGGCLSSMRLASSSLTPSSSHAGWVWVSRSHTLILLRKESYPESLSPTSPPQWRACRYTPLSSLPQRERLKHFCHLLVVCMFFYMFPPNQKIT